MPTKPGDGATKAELANPGLLNGSTVNMTSTRQCSAVSLWAPLFLKARRRGPWECGALCAPLLRSASVALLWSVDPDDITA